MSTSLIIGDGSLYNLPVDNPNIPFTQALAIPTSSNVNTSGGIGVIKTINSNSLSSTTLTTNILAVSGNVTVNATTDSADVNTGAVQSNSTVTTTNNMSTNTLNCLGAGMKVFGNLNVSGGGTLTGRVTSGLGVRSYSGTVSGITSAFPTSVFTATSGQRGYITIIGNIATHKCMLMFYFEWTNGRTFVSYTQLASSGDTVAALPGPAGTVVLGAQVSGLTLQIYCSPVGTGSINYYITLL